MSNELKLYSDLFVDIKTRVRKGQLKATLSANSEMLATYWDIGKMIHDRQQIEGWGAGVIPRLANDLKNELPDVKGFSERNILRMLTFYKEYSEFPISPLPVAKLEESKDSIGISEYELTRVLPENLKSSLPSVEEIEVELSQKLNLE